jgi:hypothetical protein
MSTSNSGANAPRKRLPLQPSEENLKKQAKRRARLDAIQLAEAQHRIANDYGFASWPKLVAYVESVRKGSDDWRRDPNDNLPKFANAGDVEKVKAMLGAVHAARPRPGARPDGLQHGRVQPDRAMADRQPPHRRRRRPRW